MSIGSIRLKNEVQESTSPPRVNWKKFALITGLTVTTLYSLYQALLNSDEETQQETALALRSVGEITSMSLQLLPGLSLFGVPFFVMGAPIPSNPPDVFEIFVRDSLRESEGNSRCPLREATQKMIDTYLRLGVVINLPHDEFWPPKHLYTPSTREYRPEVDHFSNKAESMQHPADRALYYREAKRHAAPCRSSSLLP